MRKQYDYIEEHLRSSRAFLHLYRTLYEQKISSKFQLAEVESINGYMAAVGCSQTIQGTAVHKYMM